MDIRQFFITQSLWGKILGSIFGFLVGGPVGAIFGIGVGNLFDRGLAQHFSRPSWYYHQEKRQEVQQLFFSTTFAVMGHIAKAAGHISRQDILTAMHFMDQMQLSRKQKEIAKNQFNLGKAQSFNLTSTLEKLMITCGDNPDLIHLFIDIQYQAATQDVLTASKIQRLNEIFQQLGFAPIQKQYRFYQDFSSKAHQANFSGSNQYQHNRQQSYTSTTTLDQAYAILEVNPAMTKNEIKKAYRKLISRHHPDKLIAQGLPEEMIRLANNKTQVITKAYEQICKSKGW